ncbi:DEAD-box ATP-dependent RNA helicase [Trifolium pratense]|uniref:DEAD-box ATP-dependent RNA helicase n=1 Tax=Trifolium pratense TaxID=57577 RepID=A0A2K3LB20_TRIPR|nr:DEAD-box ATP-dependent RNA helicase [Trifolium pratense]
MQIAILQHKLSCHKHLNKLFIQIIGPKWVKKSNTVFPLCHGCETLSTSLDDASAPWLWSPLATLLCRSNNKSFDAIASPLAHCVGLAVGQSSLADEISELVEMPAHDISTPTMIRIMILVVFVTIR